MKIIAIRLKIMSQVLEERKRQEIKFGGDKNDDKKTPQQWRELIADYNSWAHRMAEMNSPEKAKRRLIQIAALAVAEAEAIERKQYEGKKQ